MIRVAAFYAGLGAGCAYLLSRPGHEAYDIDSAHLKWAQIHQRNEQRALPSTYSLNSLVDLRYRFDSKAAGVPDDESVGLDQSTRQWMVAEGAQSFAQTAALIALSAFIPRQDAMAKLNLPSAHLLSSEQWAHIILPQKRRRALDVGAGAGHITSCFAPLFEQTYAVEVSDALVERLEHRGLIAGKACRASPDSLQALGFPCSFDAVFALNVLDRVPESDAFLSNLVALTAPGGLLVVALPLPYCSKPWTTPDRATNQGKPSQWSREHGLSLGTDAGASWEEAAKAIALRLRLEGLEVVRVVRAPYLCQQAFGFGNRLPLVLDGGVFVARKREP